MKKQAMLCWVLGLGFGCGQESSPMTAQAPAQHAPGVGSPAPGCQGTECTKSTQAPTQMGMQGPVAGSGGSFDDEPLPPAGEPPIDVGSAPPLDEGCSVYEFRAHGEAVVGDESPYPVGVAKDSYMNFTFNAPWDKTVYAKSLRPLIDNDEVLHHYLVYKNPAMEPTAVSISPSSAVHSGSETLAGWLPGTGDFVMPEGVAMALPVTSFTLEVHYNSTDPGAMDRSGVAICVTEDPPVNLAEMSWLGTNQIFGTTATGTCKPPTNEPVHILSIIPHMHLKGSHFKAVINRLDGQQEILHDAPFDFYSQLNYDKDVVVMPGESITTTCTYSEFASFGTGTEEEMCYLFTVAYPTGALSTPGSFQNKTTCGL